jgi:cysteine synthase A
MAVRVYIPTPYRAYTGEQTHVEVDAASVSALLGSLSERYPELRERILSPDGRLPGHLNVYVNQVETRSLQGEDTPLKDGDEVALIPAMAGGALLTAEQMERYSRHTRLDEVGVEGQRRLLDSKVLIIGAGALASPAAIYLAAAGVGTIGIVDGDRVDASNLQRQILHFTHDVGRPKVQSARRHIEDLNPDVNVVAYPTFLSSENAFEILNGYDVVVNGSDNFPTRYLVNDACVLLGKPLVDASILKWEGQATVFLPGQGCYRCLFPSPPPPGSVPSCAEAGIIGALAGHLGSLQAVETVKILLGVGRPLASRLILYDALSGDYQSLRWNRNPAPAGRLRGVLRRAAPRPRGRPRGRPVPGRGPAPRAVPVARRRRSRSRLTPARRSRSVGSGRPGRGRPARPGRGRRHPRRGRRAAGRRLGPDAPPGRRPHPPRRRRRRRPRAVGVRAGAHPRSPADAPRGTGPPRRRTGPDRRVGLHLPRRRAQRARRPGAQARGLRQGVQPARRAGQLDQRAASDRGLGGGQRLSRGGTAPAGATERAPGPDAGVGATERAPGPDAGVGAPRVADDALALIGGTPLVRLGRLVGPGSAEVLAKLESANPGGSVKDRIARSMIEAAEAEGRLSPGAEVVEATSGNTGVGLAVVCAVRGYHLILTMPEDMNAERKALFAWFGVELVLTPAVEGMTGAVFAAERIERERGAFWPRQFENAANPEAHYRATGPEIWRDAGGRVDAFVAGVGTGGTLTGVARYLKERDPGVRVVAVEPARSSVLSGGRPGPTRILGLGAGFVPGVLDRGLIDEVAAVGDEAAFDAARRLACREGLLVGPSSGAAAHAALAVARRLGEGRRVVVLLPDGGDRYASMMSWSLRGDAHA